MKVLVFTCFDKWTDICSKYKNCIDLDHWENEYPYEDSPVKQCVFSNGQAVLQDVDMTSLGEKDGVFLVYDSIDVEPFETLREECEGDTLYVLTHTHGRSQQDFAGWTIKMSLPGKHTYQRSHFYIEIFDILTDQQNNSNNRLNDIIQKVFNFEEPVQVFQNGCLTCRNTDPAFITARKQLENALKGTGLGNDFNNFLNKYDNSSTTDEYIADLFPLCEKLREWARQ